MSHRPTTRIRHSSPALLLCVLVTTLMLAACQRETPAPPRAPEAAPETPIAPVPPVAQPAREPSPPAPANIATAEPPPAPATVAPQRSSDALPSTDLPEGPIYFCDSAGVRTPIELEPRVEQLCRRHPEMGPCQYARGTCRERGGRVFTAKGEEVTVAVEKRYDERVSRVRLQEDGTVRR